MANLQKNTFSDKSLPPQIIHLNSFNAPKQVIAGGPVIKDPLSQGGSPFFINYKTKQGLPSNLISSIAMDPYGNLWLTSTGGAVSKFDGKSFTNFNRSQGLGSNVIFTVLVDGLGSLWFGTSGGLTHYNGYRFRTYTINDGLPSNYIMSLYKDNQQNLWIGTRGRGFTKYDGKTFTNLYADSPIANSYVRCILEDKQGNFWFGTDADGVTLYDGKNYTHYSTKQGLAGNSILSMVQDHSENIWFGTTTGLSKFDGKKFTNYRTAQGLPDDHVSCILQDRSDRLWIGTSIGGLCRYDGVHFTYYTTAQGLVDNNVSSLLEDRDGNLWFTSYGGGLTKCLGNCISEFNAADGLTGSLIFSITQDIKDKIWFATQESGVTSFDGRVFAKLTKAQGLSSNRLWAVKTDLGGNIWLGTDDAGVCKYDGHHFTYYSTKQGLVNNTIWSIAQEKSGNFWFGTNGGASRFDGNQFTNFTSAQGLPDNNIQCVVEDKVGNIWFGTHDDGVSKYDGKQFLNYSTAQGLASNTVYSVIPDKYGNIWFGTNNGASKFDGSHFTNYTTGEGLADNNIYAIAEDTSRGIIWFTTNQGISGMHYDSSKDGHFPKGSFENFNEKTGYLIGNLSRSLFLDNKGVLWFGSGNDKVIRFDYSLVKRNKEPGWLNIQSVQLNNETVCWNNLIKRDGGLSLDDSLALLNETVIAYGKKLAPIALDSIRERYRNIRFDGISANYPVPINLVLPFSDNNISFEFVQIDPGKPNEIWYQYQLEGYDKDWSPLTNRSRAVFGNLPEGHYNLHVRAITAQNIRTQIQYPFSILPPWQRTWWAYMLYVLCIAGIIWIIVAFRSRVLKRENRMLEEKVNNRTLQLRESLRELESAQSQLVQREKMASLGELTAGIAHEIQNPLNFVNNFSDLNRELVMDMKGELDQGNFEEAKKIAADIVSNEEKIAEHGKRADSIVKGMLQHSRVSIGEKELTDINAVCYEYLRLAFHGMRARDKSFNAELKTTFDPAIGRIAVIPQELGRVLLNLYNNAFYVVDQKARKDSHGYLPMISVSTEKEDRFIQIIVKDNGPGIPEKIKEKIFQPFFTTKPTGQGTGLGLSISYDIVKAHGGLIRVESEEGKGTEFIVELPI
jgi:signal transduction histidine kinase/ligand-binding sensor domain-containing protein